MSILRDLKSSGKLKVKHLETGGLYGVTKDHYDELLDLLDIGNNVEQTIQKPRYYHRGYTFASCDDVVFVDHADGGMRCSGVGADAQDVGCDFVVWHEGSFLGYVTARQAECKPKPDVAVSTNL